MEAGVLAAKTVKQTGGLTSAVAALSATLEQAAAGSGAVQSALKSLRNTVQSTTAATKKAARTLAAFDEIERLAAVNTGGSGGSSKKSGSKTTAESQPDLTATKQALAMLQTVQSAWDAFWNHLQTYYAPALQAWGAAWAQLRETALTTWTHIKYAALGFWYEALAPLGRYLVTEFLPGAINAFSQAFAPLVSGVIGAAATALGNTFVWLFGLLTELVNTVVQPALALALTVWQGLCAGVQAAWEAYGQPVCDAAVLAVQSLCRVLSTVWQTAVQPVLQQLIAIVDALWQQHLQPLWNDLTLCIGALSQMLLTLWNTVLMPLVNWIAATFGPVFAQNFTIIAQAVSVAVGVISDLLGTLLVLLRGVADTVTLVLQGQWNAAWQNMAETLSAVWDRMTGLISSAVSGIIELVRSMVDAIAAAIHGMISAVSGIGSAMSGAVSGAVSGARQWGPEVRALPAVARAAVPLPALATGAVLPANRAFLAMVGDQRRGTNVEAPLDTIKQAVAEVFAAMSAAGDGQPINIYLGDELLDSVIASSQSRRLLRSGGR